jgi:hypothetical protein
MVDPRTLPNFDPRLFPRCDGSEPPEANATDMIAERTLEFLAAFYEINKQYQRLVRLRQSKPAGSPTESERPILQAIEGAILAKEALDMRYSPLGFAASPVFVEGFITDVIFGAPQFQRNLPARISSGASIFLAVGLDEKQR